MKNKLHVTTDLVFTGWEAGDNPKDIIQYIVGAIRELLYDNDIVAPLQVYDDPIMGKGKNPSFIISLRPISDKEAEQRAVEFWGLDDDDPPVGIMTTEEP